jgi:hypothetical protein
MFLGVFLSRVYFFSARWSVGMRLLFMVPLAIFVVGCSAPAKVREEASTHLSGACLAMFLDNGIGRYQYVANAGTGRAAFAFASDAGGQACGMATNMAGDVTESAFFYLPPVERIEAVAIQRCEKFKPASIKAPCRVFARGNEIVWRKGLSKGLE